MNIQVTASHSDLKVSKVFNSYSQSSVPCVAPLDFCILRSKPLKLTINGAPRRILPHSYLRSRYQRCPPVCFFGGKGKSKNGDEASPWKSIEKGFGSLKKEQSVEDALRKQIDNQEYYDDGGGDGNRFGGGGGGGRGGGKGRSGGSGDESSQEFWDEQRQVIFATAGLIFVYFYLIIGDNWPKLARDYIKALFGMGTSYRVRVNMEMWANLYQKIVQAWNNREPPVTDYEFDPDELAREIADTRTWFDVPEVYDFFRPEFLNKYVKPQMAKTRRLKSKKDEDGDTDEAESEDDSIFGDYYINLDKEKEDYEKERGGKDYSKEEEDSDPFESYLIDDGNEGKEDGEEEEKDFASYLNKIDMAKAKTLLSDSSDEEEENYKGPGTLHYYLRDIYGPNVDYVEGPVKLVRRPKKKKKKSRKQKDKKKASKV